MPWLPRQESKTWGAARRGWRERPTGTGPATSGILSAQPMGGLSESPQARALRPVTREMGGGHPLQGLTHTPRSLLGLEGLPSVNPQELMFIEYLLCIRFLFSSS